MVLFESFFELVFTTAASESSACFDENVMHNGLHTKSEPLPVHDYFVYELQLLTRWRLTDQLRCTLDHVLDFVL